MAVSGSSTSLAMATESGELAAPFLAEVDPLVKALFEKLDKDEMGLTGIAGDLEELFMQRGLAYKKRLHPSRLGVDPDNRSRVGVMVKEVHALAEDIVTAGFSWTEVKKPTCREIHPQDTSVISANAGMSKSCEALPPTDDNMGFCTITCGHTNMTLRSFLAGVPSSSRRLSRQGRLSLDILDARDKKYAEACRKGLEWCVLRWQVKQHWPRALEIIMQARNLKIQREESEVEGLLAIHDMCIKYQDDGMPIDWVAIKRVLHKRMPPYAHMLDPMMALVSTFSVGKQGPYLKQYAAHFSQFVTRSLRELPPELYAAVTSLKTPTMAFAVLKAAYACPLTPENMKGKMCAQISAGHVARLLKGKGDGLARSVATCDRYLIEARALFESAKASKAQWYDAPDFAAVFANLDIKMVRFILGLQADQEVKYDTPEQIAAAFIADRSST